MESSVGVRYILYAVVGNSHPVAVLAHVMNYLAGIAEGMLAKHHAGSSVRLLHLLMERTQSFEV
nr:hypothetical protein [Cyclobacterium lianum]